MDNQADLLMLRGVATDCYDCGGERMFVPVDAGHATGEYCCTSCDAAVFLVPFLPARAARRGSRVA